MTLTSSAAYATRTMTRADFTFVTHHVGARGGTCGFVMPAPFHADALDVLYEPDPEGMTEIEQERSKWALKCQALPYALGARSERRVFHFHPNPYSNSFQTINPRYASFYEFFGGHDYILSEVTRELKRAEIEVRTLDGLVRDPDHRVPAPDYLMVDTEGTDYDVLAGARESLRTSGVAISVEAQFQPIWQNQHLFGDICRLLDELGFDVASVTPHPGLSPHRTPVGFRGRRFHTSCDAVFLRRIDSLADAIPDASARWMHTRKLAFAALMLGHVEYGIKALAAADQIGASAQARSAATEVSYMRFLDEVAAIVARTPARLPPLFGEDAPTEIAALEALSAEAAVSEAAPVDAARLRPAAQTPRPILGAKRRLKMALRNYPRVLAALRAVWQVYRRFEAAAPPSAPPPQQGSTQAASPAAPAPPYSAFERLLADHGFRDVADVVQAQRLADEPLVK